MKIKTTTSLDNYRFLHGDSNLIKTDVINRMIIRFNNLIRLKKASSLLLLIGIFLVIAFQGFAQNPGDPGNFDVRSTVYSGTPTTNVDDWFQGATGFGMIDESNTATYLGYGNPLSNTPFIVGKNFDQYETKNGVILYDAIYARDYTNLNSYNLGKDLTSFTGGSTKNGTNPSTQWIVSSETVGVSNDIVDIYAHLRRDGTTVGSDLWLDMGVTTLASSGARFIDFELYRDLIEINGAGTGFINSGPSEGHTAWTFDGSGNILSTGDLIVGLEIDNASNIVAVTLRIWVKKTDFVANGTTGSINWGSAIDGGSPQSQYGYGEILSPGAGAFFGHVNTTTVTAPPWGTYNDKATSGPNPFLTPFTYDYIPGSLGEVGLNLTAFGIDPATSGGNPCDAPYYKVIVKSRTSGSFTSQLKDFAGPYDFIGTPIIDATIDDPGPFLCDETTKTLSPLNPAGIAYYEWETLDGEFSNGLKTYIGQDAVIIQPGTYTLSASPLAGCTTSSSSITIYAQPCPVNDAFTINASSPPFTIDVSANDLDRDLGIHTVSLLDPSSTAVVSPPAAGTLVNNGDGTFTYTPDPEACGANGVYTDQFVYQICDDTPGTVLCNTAVVDITVLDDIDPVIVCPADVAVNTDNGSCDAAVSAANLLPIYDDNCPVTAANLSWTMTGATTGSGTGEIPQTVFNLGTTTVSYTITDEANLTADCSFNVVVTDNENPTITCVAAQSQTADPGVCTAAVTVVAPTFDDNCTTATITNDFNNTADASGTYPLGTTTVTWTVDDGNGNKVTCTQDITVTDDEDPTITCAVAQTQTADGGVCTAAVMVVAPSFGDNCTTATITNNFNGTADASGTYALGTTTVIWTVDDGNGNTAQCTQDITVTDDELPQLISCPQDITVQNDADICGATVNYALPVFNDNCDGGVNGTIVSGLATGSFFPPGATTVSYEYTDAAGNGPVTCSFTITVDPCSDLVTVKTLSSGDATPNEGDQVEFTITVTNNGVNDAPNVRLTDLLPTGISYDSHIPSVGSYNSVTGVWDGFSLAVGSSATIQLVGTVDAGQAGNTITNITTKAISDSYDPTTTGDDLEEAIYVNIPPVATDNESLANNAGNVTQEVILEDDGDGADSDPDGALNTATVDLDPATPGIDKTFVVAGEGTWSEDEAGNVTFAPISGFTNDPTPIDYTINDNDGNTSNIAVITVDYVPVATDDLSSGNTTNTNVTVSVLDNDTDGDMVDATTVTLELTGLPVDATCTATDAQGDCIEVTVPGQGVWSVNETTGAITFDPEVGFTADPDPITYTVEDDEGNPDSALLTIEFTPQPPTATDNESLANTAGDVTQQVVTEDDGDGVDSDPDGALSLASVDLDPGTAGVQSSLIVAGEGTWSVDGAGNVTFAPIAGFTNDPTPIDYTINDNDGNTSNIAVITVDYVPVATDDLSSGNTTNTNVTVSVLDNDTDGDMVDATTVTLELTGLPVDATCTTTDAQGDCIEVTVPGQGVWSVNETTGAITFDPEVGFTADPDPITYTVEDDEGNPDSALLTIEFTPQPPTATDNESLANTAGDVTQQVVTEDDGDGVDSDPDGALSLASVDLDPGTAGVQSSLIVAGEGTWSVDGAGNVTFAPIAGFTNDPTPIDYTINDNDGNTSNIAVITVDYVPVATNDTSSGNTTNTNVTVDVLANDTDGDAVDATTVTLELTGLPVDATCTATDAQGDCIEVTVPGQGVWSVNETTGAITFDPEVGFTADPDPITYTVEDDEGNPDSALLTIEFTPQPPTATDNESLANVAGDVTQQVVTEDDGDGVDSDPDGEISLASVDLDPGTAGVQSSLIVAGEGTWSEDGAGNVTFAPISGFTNDPTPIDYTINDNDGNTSNIAVITVDYVPVATDDLSSGNTTNTNVTVSVLDNDTDGDMVDATTVTLELTGLPVDATCTATDAQGDCIEVTVPGQGVWSVNETTGAITFDPEVGFTADPDPITYTVKDDEGNETSAILTVEFEAQPPVATDNESLANVAGNVTQQIITEDDGDGVDNDPDGALTLSSVDLDPATPGIQSSLIVAGEGTWSVDGAGNVTFAPIAGFTNDPTPITYTINDNDGNTSNVATIVVDYVPVATDDLSTGNTTNTNVTVDVLSNDTDGDVTDPTSVSLDLTGLPGDATCTASDHPNDVNKGDCIEVTVPGQGVWSVNETTGAITFDPEVGFTANPDPITYTVKDDEGNETSAILTVEFEAQPPVATDNESLANVAGNVTQQIITEDDGDGVDNDPDGVLTLTSVDLDPATPGIDKTFVVAGEGTWSEDGAGNVTFEPLAGFTNDPTPITYTINDNDGNTSNVATIVVDYVPVATDDLSTGNTTNTNVTVSVLDNDTDGDMVDATTVTLELTGLPVDATCTATDAQGDCIEVTVPGQGVWSVNETTGAITFDPETGFTADPDPITYTVEDDEGNPDSALLTIEFTPQAPTATDNESLANVAGDVTQQVVTEDDGDGVDSDPDGAISLASVDLDPGTAGVQSSLIVAGEGTWSVDGAGNVTFAPISGFTNDPTPIDYTINDNDGNTSNTATIIVDYVPVATDDLSSGNTTNTNVTVSVLDNDTDGDMVDATTVTLELTGLPVDATCTATDAQGDCIEVTVPGQGVWSVDETTGSITFDPEAGFTADPDPITYTVEDHEGNPDSATLTIEFDVQAPTATDNESLANTAGDVTQQVVTEDDGDGVDADPDGALALASVDLDPGTAGVQSSLVVAGEGTWSVDGAGNVTFAPIAGFTNDPTPIEYTINDNDGNTSNVATIVVDYVPVATDDLSTGNTTNTNVTVDVLGNDTDGDAVDPTSVSLDLTGLPGDATCTATDAAGDCIEVTVPGQGVWTVNETSGAITFDPEAGFTANPDPITYTVKDDEGNETSAILTVEFDAQPPVATDNESLANVAGNVTQQVVTEDDGDGLDNDPDGALDLASIDLDPANPGIQSSLVVAGEGTWSVDGAGNVTFAPIAGFTNDPTPIEYTINDNDGNTSNTATIIVDYVPVATADLSTGNTTNTNVTVDILANDTDGDLVDATTVTLELTGLPVDATCTATDAQGDCIEVTVPGQGVWSVDETIGSITFDPEAGFTADPDPITYTVEDHEGNPDSATLTIEFDVQAPTATDNESLANTAGDVTQQVVTEDDGDGVDADPDGALALASVDLDPGTAGVQSSLVVAGEGTWSVDGAGNVTFAPIAGFTNDPTPIEYTINDNDGNTSNVATIVVDYVPVATDDLSTGNTTNTNVTVDVLGNDTDGDAVDPTSVSLDLTGLPGDATCTATDAAGDCIEVTVPGQGVWTVNETSGAITFDPEAGFTANPDPITYTVKDDEGNETSAILTVEFDAQPPVATDNESLANVAGNVTQQVVTEDDGDGLDNDPDGALDLASIDLDPANPGIQSSLIVAGEGTWSVDAAGNVTFAPIAGFTNDPTPITYTINDNDGNTSNVATIVVDYVPVATDDLSTGNTTNTNVTVDVLGNDTDGDAVDPTSVSLDLTGLPGDATCTATDAAGDCIEVTVPGQGVWTVNETSGAITFDPEAGFTANPDPITYTVKDDEGNENSAILTVEFDAQPPVATDNESLANVAGNVTQQVVTEDDGDGVDNDPDGALTLSSVDLDPATPGIQSSLVVAGEGTWSVDGAGNVTFAPIAGFTNDPTPIEYTINDNDGNTSNTATIIVDYVPVATADLSTGNTTNTNVTVDVLGNDTDGDLVDATTVTLELTGLPGDATCTATDAQGDCIEVTVPGQGVWSVDETTGAITFDPEAGFTADPDPITYTVEDHEGNPDSATLTIEFDVQAPTATDNESLANTAGDVTQQVVTEDDGDGVDADPDGALALASVDLDPATPGIQSSLVVAGEGTWSVDGAGNVTFAPIAGFTNDPTPIEYTINDNDGNTSNTATIIVDYVPVATADLSTGNTTNTNVTVDILANDTDGDLVDATTVTLELTGLPVDATCTATDAQGDCIEVTVPGQGVWSVDETTGAITFDPEAGFTADPDPITYTVEDHEGNPDSATLTIEFDVQAPTATDNESLANAAGDVTQQIITEDDGDGVDNDPDGALTLSSVDLDPATPGIQSSLIVAGEGTWSVDGAGNVTFEPLAGFTNDPTPITYTINDNDGNTSNVATIVVDYVPVATDDLSTGNTTNTNVTVDVLSNDTDGDVTDPTSVSLDLTGLPGDATCTASDHPNDVNKGDCIEVTVPGQGVWTVNETSGAITFDPEAGFTANPDPITYTVKDDEGNETSAILTVEFDAQPPVATDNESLANVAGNVTQQIITEDDGDGVDNDPDGALTLASVDLDPATPGIQSSLIVAGEGTWSVDGAGNVTFEPLAGFTNDPTPITYTINDNDGNTSNVATIVVDYVPVATDDSSTGNTVGDDVILDVTGNDSDGDVVDVSTVSFDASTVPGGVGTDTDGDGDIDKVVGDEGTWTVDESGNVTFSPTAGLTDDPTPIDYTVEDDEGNTSEPATITIDYYNLFTISGTIYDDLDGGTVDGTGVGSPDGTQLYINLVDASGDVVAVVAVDADGIYIIEGAAPGEYSLILSTTEGIVGNTAPAANLPTYWSNTNEGLGPNATGDGTPDGVQSITLTTDGQINVDFGISKCPDLTITYKIGKSIVIGDNIEVECRVVVAELNDRDTDDSPIAVFIPKSTLYTMLPYDPEMGTSTGLPVLNGDWTYFGEVGSNYVFQFTGNEGIIPAKGLTAFGFKITYSTNNSAGKENVVARLFQGSGGECNLTNNTDSETFNFSF